MKKIVFIIVTVLMAVYVTNAQEVTRIGRATISYNKNYTGYTGFYDDDSNYIFNICWFSFNYPSTGGDGKPIMLSALACMPDEGDEVTEINNVIAGCHITITDNKQCPSEFNQTDDMLNDVFLTMILAGNNRKPQDDMAYHNLVILPDYEGYGITRNRTHPYLCEEITARQVTDAIRYGIQLYQTAEQVESVRRPFRQDWRTICTGYSQGGAVAMATQRFIEQQGLSDELHLAGSVCGGGPYSPLATLLSYLEQDRKGKDLSLPVVLPLMLKGLCDYDETMTGHQVNDYLEERFLETGVLDWLAAKNKTTDDITNAWKQLYENGKAGDKSYYHTVLTSSGSAYLRNIIKPELLNNLSQILDQYPDYATSNIPLPEGGTLAEDLHIALEHNNLGIGWEPCHPICLFHSTGDEIVPYQNYESAASNLGTQVLFYPSEENGTHVSTGTEFFIGSVRFNCIRMLATRADDSGEYPLIVDTFKETDSWYDLSGRSIIGKPTVKGIYINKGKKLILK